MTIRDLKSGAELPIFETGTELQWTSDGQSLYFIQNRTLRRLAVNTNGEMSAAGISEVVLYLGSKFNTQPLFTLDPNSDRIILLAEPISFTGNRKRYSTMEWWRNYADELDRILEGK